MSRKSHVKHEQVRHTHHDSRAANEAIAPDFPQRHKVLMVVILIIFAIMSTVVFAFLYVFG